MKKIYLFISLIVLIVMASACENMRILPSALGLEDSVKEIISSKGNDYDFLNDKQYMAKMDELVKLLVDNDLILENQIKIANLNDDNIPEIIIFRERDMNNTDDQGYLEVYSYSLGKYSLLDRVPMNYDNTNIQLEVGKISPNRQGILLINQAASKSTVTYGFIIDKGKLLSVLNDKKLNLISISADNEIYDIDNDGILEFSIYTNDPESKGQDTIKSDKIIYWYRWDGVDSANLIKIERIKDFNTDVVEKSDSVIFKMAQNLLNTNGQEFISYLRENKGYLSQLDTNTLLKDYIDLISKKSSIESSTINNLFSKYKLSNSDELVNKYGLSLDRLNDITYLNRERSLSSEAELKQSLINNLNRGYKLSIKNSEYTYTIDYSRFIDLFGENILKEYRDYYKILAQYYSYKTGKENPSIISIDKLSEKIISIENFKTIYPYSSFLSELDMIYDEYLSLLFSGLNNTNKGSITSRKELLAQFNTILEKYPHSNLGDILGELLQANKQSSN